jgi:F-type H+-transporting ATPase subunit b
MTRLPKIPLCFCLFLALAAPAAVQARAQDAPAPSTASSSQAANTPAQQDENDVYLHSASVRTVAGWLHLDTGVVAESLEILNFAILAAAILYGLFKFLPQALRTRRENIQQRLADARTATQEARERLRAVEEKFARLDEEIALLRSQAEREGAADEERMKALLESERQRIIASAEQEIAAAALGARRELKRFAGELAVQRAQEMVSVDDDRDRALLQQFNRQLGSETRNGGRN